MNLKKDEGVYKIEEKKRVAAKHGYCTTTVVICMFAQTVKGCSM
jgi:hypothetical protein